MAVNIMGLRPDVRAKYEAFQKQFGIDTNSAYRSPEYNAGVKGARNSQHTHGNAIDLPIGHLEPQKQAEVMQYWRDQGAKGFGYYNNGSAHVDFRETPAAWGPNRSRTSLPQTPQWFQEFAAGKTPSFGGQPVPSTPAQAPQPPARPSMFAGTEPQLRGGFDPSMGATIQNASTGASPMAPSPMAAPAPIRPPASQPTPILPQGSGSQNFGLLGPVAPKIENPVAPGVGGVFPNAQGAQSFTPSMSGFDNQAQAQAPAAAPEFNTMGALSAGLGAIGKWATAASQPEPVMQAPKITGGGPHQPKVDPSSVLEMFQRKRYGGPEIGRGLLG